MYESLNIELEQLKENNLYRELKKIDRRDGPRIKVNDQWLIDFSSNDYLGLTQNKLISHSIAQGLDQYGNGAGASHLISGHYSVHDELENLSAKNTKMEKSLFFASGYIANLSFMTSVIKKEHYVFMDRLNHASLNQGVFFSQAKFSRFNHLDYDHLELLLSKKKQLTKWIITDGVFSMDGDIANIPKLVQLCQKYNAYLYIDDAHGYGVLGKTGQGILEFFSDKKMINTKDLKRIIYLNTLGKSAGVSGALMNAKKEIIDYITQKAKPYIYSTATSPALAQGIITSMQLVKESHQLRQNLALLIHLFRTTLKIKDQLLESITPIQPIVLNSEKKALFASLELKKAGFFVPAIRPPTVEKNSSRLRVSISANHTQDNIKALVTILNQVLA